MDVGKADLKFIGVREEHAEDKGRQVIGCGHHLKGQQTEAFETKDYSSWKTKLSHTSCRLPDLKSQYE